MITNKQVDEMVGKLRSAFGAATTENLITLMVSRFLSWKLPKDFAPDAGISFKPSEPWPIGTNLLTAEQAREMIAHMLKPNEQS